MCNLDAAHAVDRHHRAIAKKARGPAIDGFVERCCVETCTGWAADTCETLKSQVGETDGFGIY